MLKKLSLIGALVILVNPALVRADEIPITDCSESNFTQSGSSTIPPGQYDVYASSNLGTLTIQVYVNEYGDLNPSHCTTITKDVPVGTVKTLIGQTSITKQSPSTWYVRTDIQVDDALSTNRLLLHLVPKGLEICIEKSCNEPDRTTSSVKPVQNAASSNRVIVGYYTDPATDGISKIDYYGDDRFLFSKNEFMDFPDEYKESGDYQVLTTLARYSSGQTILRSQYVGDIVGSGTIIGYYSKYLAPYHESIRFLLIAIGVFGLLMLVLLIVNRWREKRKWKYAHGYLISHNSSQQDSQKLLKRVALLDKLLNARKISIVFISLIFTITFTNIFVMDIFTVSGHSMDTTLHTGQKLVIAKLPVTIAKLGNGIYIPKRGSIVVAKVSQEIGVNENTFGNGKKSMVKRVVGLPGDRVIVIDNTITVYFANQKTGLDFDKGSKWEKQKLDTDDSYNIDITVAPDELFVVGDNRDASIDSRINGPIKADQVIGLLIGKL